MTKEVILWDRNKIAFELTDIDTHAREPNVERIKFAYSDSWAALKAHLLDREIGFLITDDFVRMYVKVDSRLIELRASVTMKEEAPDDRV